MTVKKIVKAEKNTYWGRNICRDSGKNIVEKE